EKQEDTREQGAARRCTGDPASVRTDAGAVRGSPGRRARSTLRSSPARSDHGHRGSVAATRHGCADCRRRLHDRQPTAAAGPRGSDELTKGNTADTGQQCAGFRMGIVTLRLPQAEANGWWRAARLPGAVAPPRSVCGISVVGGFSGDQVRDPDWLAEELLDLLLNQLIPLGHTLILPQVLDPGLQKEGFDKSTRIGGVLKDAPRIRA